MIKSNGNVEIKKSKTLAQPHVFSQNPKYHKLCYRASRGLPL